MNCYQNFISFVQMGNKNKMPFSRLNEGKDKLHEEWFTMTTMFKSLMPFIVLKAEDALPLVSQIISCLIWIPLWEKKKKKHLANKLAVIRWCGQVCWKWERDAIIQPCLTYGCYHSYIGILMDAGDNPHLCNIRPARSSSLLLHQLSQYHNLLLPTTGTLSE